jgi:N-acetylneuraminic acid mutarotase
MAYDSARDRVVVFAGSHTLRDVWEWNPGTRTWTERTPATSTDAWPPPLYGHAMVYDAGRKKMFVFGGGTTVGVRNDTWEWDGAAGTWEKRSTTSPPALSSHAMAYDAARGKVVLFGGYDNSFNGVAGDLWEWDGAAGTWTRRSPGTMPGAWPSARDATSLVFDSMRKKIVLFGGFDNAGTFFRDLWEWDGDSGTWMNRTPAVPPMSWPDARANHAAVYDARRDRTVIFGGGPTRREVWEWNAGAGTWEERLPSNPLAEWPTGRAAHAMAYDSLRFNAILFGGCCLLQDLWSWNGGD